MGIEFQSETALLHCVEIEFQSEIILLYSVEMEFQSEIALLHRVKMEFQHNTQAFLNGKPSASPQKALSAK